MFLGPEGTGNMALALAYAQYINCHYKVELNEEEYGFSKDSCGECASCKKIQNLSHPDLHFYLHQVHHNNLFFEPQIITSLN